MKENSSHRLRVPSECIHVYVLCCPLLSEVTSCSFFPPQTVFTRALLSKMQTEAFQLFYLTYSCSQDLECDVSVEDDNRQEWIFTLYDFDNSGKVTKEVCVCVAFPCSAHKHSSIVLILWVCHLPRQDMSSLMHTIYDVVDASVNHSCHNKSKTLRVKLTVTPEPRSHRREAGTGKWQQNDAIP